MRLHAVLFTAPAERQLFDILAASEAGFGETARKRYESLVLQALEDLLDDPRRPGAREIAGRVHYHLRNSRTRVRPEAGRVATPRHVIVARIVGADLLVLAFGHDGVVDDLAARIEEAEDD